MKAMREIQETNVCGRAEGLVGYLYGEATADERATFEGHLAACAGCRDELAAFRQVRTAVGEWRAEVLQAAPALALSEVTGQAGHSHARPAPPPKRSARAALREFFALSPAWLRASSVAAALLLCALAAQAALDVRPSPAGATKDDDNRAALAARLNELAAERDAARRELEETRAQLDDSRATHIEDALFEEAATTGTTVRPAAREDSPRARRASPPAPRRASGASGTRSRRDEEDLPRLLDLLGDAN